MVVLDGLGSLPQTQGWSPELLSDLRRRATSTLASLTPLNPSTMWDNVTLEADTMAIGPFRIKRGTNPPVAQKFAFQAPTTLENARRVLRACQLTKAILLEGSPGVGKTSLVSAIASFSGQDLCRVNLSDQTDLIDLFGSDFPLEGGAAGEFVWRDAAFLQAFQNGHWVLLDEMNLAPQSVLEGLNAILDHRGAVFLPELGRSFTKHPDFRLFAAQNPVQQGGGRKGLPKSFLNRFTKVYMEELNSNDLLIISKNLHPGHSEDELQHMIDFNSRVHHEATVRRSMGRQGSPWEFNLRDIMRWLALRESTGPLELDPGNPTEYMDEIYSQRFRTPADRLDLHLMENKVFSRPHDPIEGVHVSFSARYAQFGHSLIERKPSWQQPAYLPPFSRAHFKAFQAMAKCVNEGWLIILVGQAATGKTTILRQFAALNGERIETLSATSATDASDLLGGFEQEQGVSMAEQVVSGELQEPMNVDGAFRLVDHANG
jgi:midasin